jgi:hypothetical protein
MDIWNMCVKLWKEKHCTVLADVPHRHHSRDHLLRLAAFLQLYSPAGQLPLCENWSATGNTVEKNMNRDIVIVAVEDLLKTLAQSNGNTNLLVRHLATGIVKHSTRPQPSSPRFHGQA